MGKDRTDEAPDYAVPALEKALDILELLSARREGLTQNQIGAEVGRSASQIFRTLAVLEQRGYLVRERPAGLYFLSMRLFEMAHRHPATRGLVQVAVAPMRRLAETVRQSCNLGVAYFGRMIIVAEAESRTGTKFEAVPLDALPDLPFDHARIVAAAAERLRAKVAYSTLLAFLLEPTFTFAEYKSVFEKVLGRTVDQSSLRKKLMDADVLEEVGKRSVPSGPGVRANRPGRLYRLRNPEPVLFDRSL